MPMKILITCTAFILVFFLLHFLDINECEQVDACHANAICNNTMPSYDCECKEGFDENGFLCAGKGKLICAMQMLYVTIQCHHTIVNAWKDLMEMDSSVQVITS